MLGPREARFLYISLSGSRRPRERFVKSAPIDLVSVFTSPVALTIFANTPPSPKKSLSNAVLVVITFPPKVDVKSPTVEINPPSLPACSPRFNKSVVPITNFPLASPVAAAKSP